MSHLDYQRKKIFSFYSKTFYFASRFLDKDTIIKIQILYDFCRYCDNITDDCTTEEEKAYAREILEKIATDIKNRKSSIEKVSAFIELIENEKLPLYAVSDLIEGFKSDLNIVRIKDQADLLDYCYKVAGTIGLLMCPILKCDSEAAKSYAIKLGIALQLTNIARDVMEDARKNRVYLPISMTHDTHAESLIHSQQHQQVMQQIRDILQLAETYYNAGLQGLRYMHSRNQLAILLAARIYQKIGFNLEKRGYEYWRGRVKTTLIEKCVLVIQSLREWIRQEYRNEHTYL